jgi:predicted ribosomally synthesized peptide with nif11-like leader
MMSIGNAQQFIDLLEHDPTLQAQFTAAAPENIDAVLAFAAHNGYVFSADDLTIALQASPKSRLAKDYAGPHLHISPYEV